MTGEKKGYMESFTVEEIAEWNSRSDVLYHFNALQWFSLNSSLTAIDLVNLDDADVLYYNRVSDMIHGLSSPHKLAEYLNTFAETHPELPAEMPTHRARFIAHVYEYNRTRIPRRRLYMVGLSSSELEFVKHLSADPLNPMIVNGVAVPAGPDCELVVATNGCLEGRSLDVEAIKSEVEVQEAVRKCLDKYERQKLRAILDLKGFVISTQPLDDSLDAIED